MIIEIRETKIIAFYNLLLGISVVLGSLAYYLNFTPINVGGVFFLLVGILSILILIGLGFLVFWNHNRFGKVIETFIKVISQPVIAISIIVFIVVAGWISLGVASARYPFLGTVAFYNGMVLVLYSFVVLVGSSHLNQIFDWLKSNLTKMRQYQHLIDRHWIMVLVLCGIIFFTFRNSYSGALLRLDDLIMIDYARNESLFAAITSPPETYSVFYRPMHNLVLWVYYELFGLDYSRYQFAELFGHFATVILFYWLVHLITENKLLAVIGGILFGTHIYVSVGVVYVNAVFWWLGIFGVLSQIIIVRARQMRWYSMMGLGILLLLNLLIGEYGFALVGALCLMALYQFITREQDRKYAIKLFLLGVLVTVIYFGMRWQAVGLLPESGGGSSGYFWEFYTNPRILGINHYIYTVVANLISSFVPIFNQVGVLMLPPIVQILVGITIFSIYIFGVRKISENSINGFLWLPILYIYLMGSKEIVKYLIGNYNLTLTFSLHTMLNIAIAFLILGWKNISKEHRRVAVFALGMLLGGSVVAFAYFRWRTHYYTHMAWILLVIIGINYFKSVRNGKAILTSLMLISVLLSWKSMKIIDSRLPAIKVEQFQQNLCDSRVSKDLAMDMISYYQIDDESVLECVLEK